MSQNYNPIELCTTVTKALLNNNFNAVRSNFSGGTFPSNPVGGQFFVHTGTEPWTLYLYNSDDVAWIPVTAITLDSNALVSFMAALANANDVDEGAALVGYRGLTVHNKLDRVVDVKDFGAVCDGVTDDTAAVLEALDYMSTDFGYGVVRISGKCYCASDITLPAQVGLCGYMPSIGSTRLTTFAFDDIDNCLLLNDSSNIILGHGSSVFNLYILNEALVGRYPFANYSDAANAIAAFGGTAITGDSVEDTLMQNLRIIGFDQAIYTNMCDRHKISHVEGDNTAGIWISNCYDIARLSNCHFWPYIIYLLTGWTNVFSRGGSAYKVTGHFDGGMIDNCFSYGYAIGYDIQAPQNVTLANCHCDSYGDPGSSNISNVGYKFSSTARHCMMEHCGASSQDIGVLIDGNDVRINIDNCQFWGNETHIRGVNAASLTLHGNHFFYLNSAWTPDYQVDIDGVSGYVQIIDNTFQGQSNTWDGIYVQNQTYPVQFLGNTFQDSKTAITIAATSRCTTNFHGNYFGDSTTGIVFGDAIAQNLADIGENGYIPGFGYGTLRTSYAGYGESCKSFGAGPHNVHYNIAYGGSAVAPAAVGLARILGIYCFSAYDGVDQTRIGASIRAQTDSTNAISDTSVPTSLIFGTCAVGSATCTDRFGILPDGTFAPVVSNLYDIGDPLLRVANTYSTNIRPGDGTVIWTSGAGSPEGVVTALVGSLYTRTDGGANTTLYVKQSGSGSTGWAAK